MKATVSFLTLGVLAFALGCSSVSVKHDYDKETNFASLKTYNWVAVPANATGSVQAALQRNGLLDKRIKESTNSELAAKGYTQDANNPDFRILYHTGAQDKINVTDWGYGYGRYGGWYGGGVDVNQYTEGTLILDIIEPRSNQLIWRGYATGAIDPGASMETRERRLNEVIAKILARFPPTAR